MRVQTIGRTAPPSSARARPADAPLERALRGRRPAYFGGRFVDTPVYDGDRVGAGHAIDGPAIIEEPFTTIVLHPGQRAELDASGTTRSRSAEIEEYDVASKVASDGLIDLDTSDVDRWIGVPLGGARLIEPIHANDVRRWAQGTANPNPLYFDEDYAAESRFGRLVAPQSFAVCTDTATARARRSRA